MIIHNGQTARSEYSSADSPFRGTRTYVTFEQNGKTYMMPVKNKYGWWYYNKDYVYNEKGEKVRVKTKQTKTK